jgi:DNA-binding transcriptional MerR regulator
MQKLLLSKREIATACGVSVRTIDTWVSQRLIPVIKTSKRKNLFRLDGVLDALKRLERKAVI